MRALRIESGVILRSDQPEPRPAAGEALVRVRLAGICQTDLELAAGYLGFRGTPGHEFVGEIVTAPPESALAPGQRVVGEINAGCGHCAWCRGEHPGAFVGGVDPHRLAGGRPTGPGDSRHCPNRTVLGILGRDGALADYLTLPVGNLQPVPDGLPDEAAVFVEPVAAAGEILDQVAVGPTTRALVLGDGKLGLLIAQVLAAAGCSTRLAGRHPAKLQIAADCGIATALTDALPTEAYDLVVEATGSPGGLARALALVRPRGTLVLKTTVAAPITLDLAPIVINEVRLLGSRCGRFAPALDWLASGHVRVAPLIAARYPLDAATEALAAAGRPGVLKVLVVP